VVLGGVALLLAWRVAYEGATAMAAFVRAVAWVDQAQRLASVDDSITQKMRLALIRRAESRDAGRVARVGPDGAGRPASGAVG
jgi:hypothetical protein